MARNIRLASPMLYDAVTMGTGGWTGQALPPLVNTNARSSVTAKHALADKKRNVTVSP